MAQLLVKVGKKILNPHGNMKDVFLEHHRDQLNRQRNSKHRSSLSSVELFILIRPDEYPDKKRAGHRRKDSSFKAQCMLGRKVSPAPSANDAPDKLSEVFF